MPEYIERAAAAKIICAWCGTCPNPTVEDLLKCDDICPEFAQIPAADVRPVKRGHWVKRMEEHATPKYTSFTPIWSCSECGLEYDPALAPRVHFCYDCGADMREEGVSHG